jgi:protein-S-isoprenylcysteine O-methyltransferase Ste14
VPSENGHGSKRAILLLPLMVYVIQREVIEREERYLERTFGRDYLDYKARVRRWVCCPRCVFLRSQIEL